MTANEHVRARLSLALAMADEAGRLSRARFRSPLTIEVKGDRSPVSEVDREVETALWSLVERAFPGDRFVGEEFEPRGPDGGLEWVVDPIDGTRAFLAGLPTFVTLIALLDDGRPVLGVIDQPITGDRWIGVAGEPTRHRGAAARARRCATLDRALVAATDPLLFEPSARSAFERLAAATCTRVTGGDGMLYGLLASGTVDLVCEAGLALHDFAAVVPIVEGAGGWIGDWSGRALRRGSDGRVLAAGDPRLVDAALTRLGGDGAGG